MLQLSEQRKQLVARTTSPYESPFDIHILNNTDNSKSFEVEFDPIGNVIYLTINTEEQSFMLTLTASQAVSVGQWLTEAAYVLNFIEKAGIQFEETTNE